VGKTAHPIFSDLSPDQLAAAVEENLITLVQQFGVLGEYREDCPPGVKRSVTNLRFLILNSITGARLEPEQVGATIDWITADARTRGIPLAWLTGPLTQPADFTVRHMCDEAGWRLWADTNARIWGGGKVTNYEDNPWCRIFRAADPEVLFAYVGCLSDQPLASSLMLLDAGVAGLYLVGTIPEARRQGIGACMCLESLREACRRGYGVGVLESTEMGLNVYRKLGFKEVCLIHFYGWKP
jgi:GNAT superfamily N-acetyltransferase